MTCSWRIWLVFVIANVAGDASGHFDQPFAVELGWNLAALVAVVVILSGPLEKATKWDNLRRGRIQPPRLYRREGKR